MESKLHKMLKEIGRSKLGYMGMQVVATEVQSSSPAGQLDVVGAKREWVGQDSRRKNNWKIITIGIEVKVSVHDFFSKKQKVGHELEKERPSFGGVNYQYFLIPKGLLDYERVYDGWGIMIWNGKSIKIVKQPVFRDCESSEFLFNLSRAKDNWTNDRQPYTYGEILSKYKIKK